MMNSPLLARSDRAGQFLRLCLAEVTQYGVPGSAVVVLDDIAAMLGLYEALPQPAASHVGGPMVAWRTSPKQPSFERIEDVERLAYKQRALIAFGGGPPGQMVGVAEIVCAMGNIIQGTSPPDYYDIYQWASLKVIEELSGTKPEEVLNDPSKANWRLIPDADVLEPGGRLYATYQIICTNIRRESIAQSEANPDYPRTLLKPFARLFLEGNAKARREAELSGADPRVFEMIDESTRIILSMFPDLSDVIDAPPPLDAVEQADALQ
jgi:hypothetical protein